MRTRSDDGADADPRDAAPPGTMRERILDVVTQSPGIPLSDLRARVPAAWGTLYHHLVALTRAGRVRTVTVGRRRLAFPTTAAHDPRAEHARALLRGRTAASIAVAIESNGATGVGALARATGRSPRAVHYHVSRLIAAGLVVPTSRTRDHGLRATPLLERLVGAGAVAAPAGNAATEPQLHPLPRGKAPREASLAIAARKSCARRAG